MFQIYSIAFITNLIFSWTWCKKMKKKTPIYMACIFHEYVLQWNYSLVWRDSIVWRDLNCECLFLKVIAATNRVDILDPALLRSGRLDRKIEFPHPNEEARARILQIHSRKMNVRYRIAICHVCCKIHFGCDDIWKG